MLKMFTISNSVTKLKSNLSDINNVNDTPATDAVVSDVLNFIYLLYAKIWIYGCEQSSQPYIQV